MEKLLFIVCFIFTLGNTNAQTKEQTIAWINTYASELLPSVNMSVNENDELVIARGKTKKNGSTITGEAPRGGKRAGRSPPGRYNSGRMVRPSTRNEENGMKLELRYCSL